MSPRGNPRIGRTREEIEQDTIAAAVEKHQQELDEQALAGKPPVEMTAYEKGKLEEERRALQEALRDTRPPRPAADAPAPESLSTRVKDTSQSTPEPVPEPVAVEPVVIVPDAQLAEATERQRLAQETLALAQAGLEEADAVLAQAKADHAAQQANQQLQSHRAVLVPALARAQRQQADFQRLFDQYGGAGRGGTTHGPLARYAKTIPVGDPQRRERLMLLYREAGVLMERIRLGYQAAHAAVAACEKALTVGGTGDAADLRLELAGAACEAAIEHDAGAVRTACDQLIAAVNGIDGEPAPDVVVYLEGPSRDAVKQQTRAEGVGDPI